MKAKHTPTPPFTVSNYTEHHSEIYDADNHCICIIKNANLLKVKAYRDFIVKACNTHDELVEAIEQAITELNDYIGEWQGVEPPYCPSNIAIIKNAIEYLEQALAKAKE